MDRLLTRLSPPTPPTPARAWGLQRSDRALNPGEPRLQRSPCQWQEEAETIPSRNLPEGPISPFSPPPRRARAKAEMGFIPRYLLLD